MFVGDLEDAAGANNVAERCTPAKEDIQTEIKENRWSFNSYYTDDEYAGRTSYEYDPILTPMNIIITFVWFTTYITHPTQVGISQQFSILYTLTHLPPWHYSL